jgi:hypothetical protein
MTRTCVVGVCVLSIWLGSGIAAAQTDDRSIHVGAQLTGAMPGEFEGTDLGVGGLVAWHPSSLFGVEAEINVYPGDFGDNVAFSGGRLEGLFGATVGPLLGRVRPFVKMRPGFLRYAEASEPFACILIFPPPLNCTLGAGKTVFALDLGGGIEFYPTSRTFVRADVGDRVLRYDGPALASDFQAIEESFYSHDFRVSVGGGVRF